VVLTGPRQSGKTTLVRHFLRETHALISLDEPDVREVARRDPRTFLSTNKPPVIFDEIQYAPELLNYIKHHIDKNRNMKGQYVLTGSQMFPLMSNVSESLAGRASVLTLHPLSWGERLGTLPSSSPVEYPVNGIPGGPGPDGIAEGMLRGGFPELTVEKDRDSRRWYSSYVQTYLERDVRNLRNVGDIEEFLRFIKALAARNGQLINMADIGRDIGLALNTVKAWISILVASHQVVLLRPYFRNMGKRLVKSPRVYFMDSGLVCYLSGIQTAKHLLNGPMGGALFESEFIAELIKWNCNKGYQPALYSWRTSDGKEVDCVMEEEGRLWPFEVKSSSTFKVDFAGAVADFMETFPEAKHGRVVYAGEKVWSLADDRITAVPFSWVSMW